MSREELIAALRAVWTRHNMDLRDEYMPGITQMFEEMADVAVQAAAPKRKAA